MTTPRAPRDSQRSRVYRAETPLPSSPLPGLPACATFADRVVGSLWWQARFPDLGLGSMPRFRPGNGARQAFFREDEDGPTITLPRRYRTKGVVLHELVHWALHREVDLPHHGRTFTRVLVDATLEFGGPERADALLTSFRTFRVRSRQAGSDRPRRPALLRLGRTPAPGPRARADRPVARARELDADVHHGRVRRLRPGFVDRAAHRPDGSSTRPRRGRLHRRSGESLVVHA